MIQFYYLEVFLGFSEVEENENLPHTNRVFQLF